MLQPVSQVDLILDMDGKISMNPSARVVRSRYVTFGNGKPPTLSESKGHLVGSDRKPPKSGSSDKSLTSSTRFAVLKFIDSANSCS